MTGPEHYREAERMAGHCATQVAEADIYAGGDDDEISDVTHAYIALAQVHATLALGCTEERIRELEEKHDTDIRLLWDHISRNMQGGAS